MADLNQEVDWWWIDFLENELDSSLEKDLETLLANSQEDRDRFEVYRLLREWLGESDPIGSWPLERRLEKVRRNVMRAIETSSPQTRGAEPYLPAGVIAERATKSLNV